MTPDLVPFFNRTNVTLDFFVSQYPSNRKIHSTVVEAMNGTAEFEVFLERNHFSNDIVVKVSTLNCTYFANSFVHFTVFHLHNLGDSRFRKYSHTHNSSKWFYR